MTRSNSKLRGLSFISVLSVAASTHAEGDWLRHFRIGGSVGMNIKTEFKTSGLFNVNPTPPSGRGGVTYDDGFVGVDDTGNENNLTTFWGYNSSSQYNSTSDRLTFHQTQSFSASGFEKSDDFPPGFDMVYAGTFRRWDRVAIGGELGFNLTVFGAREKSPMNAILTQRVDQYDVGGTVLPSAPYSGPEAGRGTTAPVISSIPI